MFKLYRVLDDYEYDKLKKGILTFKVTNKDIRNINLNTFFYGENSNSNLAHRKHFFLTKEDAYTFSRMTDINHCCVHMFYIPEQLVVNNIGFGNYGREFNPLEVAIPSTELKNHLNLKSIVGINELEFLSIDGSDLNIQEELLDNSKTEEFYNYESLLCNILSEFYIKEGCLSLEKSKRYFDDEQNRIYIIKKIKEIYKY